jgi:hypothetical protein
MAERLAIALLTLKMDVTLVNSIMVAQAEALAQQAEQVEQV